MRRLKVPKRLPKAALLGVSIGLFILLAGGYVWWSAASWGSYEQKYTEKQQAIQRSLETVWSMPADTIEQKRAKLAHLASVNAEISGVSPESCNQPVLIGWQRVIQTNAEHEKACRDSIQSVQEFSASLKPAIEFLQQSEAMAKIIAQAPSQTEATEADFVNQLSTWRTILESVKNLPSSSDFDTVKQAAQGSIEGVVRAWEEVIAAHEAKDKARYTKAMQALAATYDKLGDITGVHDERLNSLMTKLKN